VIEKFLAALRIQHRVGQQCIGGDAAAGELALLRQQRAAQLHQLTQIAARRRRAGARTDEHAQHALKRQSGICWTRLRHYCLRSLAR
jgi:hypothetical protein